MVLSEGLMLRSRLFDFSNTKKSNKSFQKLSFEYGGDTDGNCLSCLICIAHNCGNIVCFYQECLYVNPSDAP